MNSREAVRATLEALTTAGVPHMLTGGLVVNLYTIPRFTKDADIVIQMQSAVFDEFQRLLPSVLHLDPQVTFETITGSHRHIVTLERSEFRIELFLLGKDPHHGERFARRRKRYLPDLNTEGWVATPEDMIIQKLRWNRDKDREDVKNIIGVQGDALDWPYIERWCDAHGTRARLEEIRAAIPEI